MGVRKLNKKKSAVKGIMIGIMVMMLGLYGCGKPRTEIISTTIETGIATSGGITQIIEGHRPARIDFIIYNFGETPLVENANDSREVTAWFVTYAHFYQNGEELKKSYHYYHANSFKPGKQCKITVFYQVPDNGNFSGLNFKFDLDGFTATYDGLFVNNVK